jgi:hypothetical protein
MVLAGAILLATLHSTGTGEVYTICPEEPAIGSIGNRQAPADCRPVVIED